MVEISEDLKKLVSTTIESVKAGMRGTQCGVLGTIDFDLAVVVSKEAKSGFKFFILDASAHYSKETISKISFKVLGTPTGTKIDQLVWLNNP